MVVFVEDVPNASPLRTQLGTQDGKNPLKTRNNLLSTCYEQLRAISIIAGEVIFKSQSNGHRGRESLWTGAHLSACLSLLALRYTNQFTHCTRADTITSIGGTVWSLFVGPHFVCTRTHRQPWDNTGDTMHNPAAMLCCWSDIWQR